MSSLSNEVCAYCGCPVQSTLTESSRNYWPLDSELRVAALYCHCGLLIEFSKSIDEPWQLWINDHFTESEAMRGLQSLDN